MRIILAIVCLSTFVYCGTLPNISSEDYAYVRQQIDKRILALRSQYPSMAEIESTSFYEFNTYKVSQYVPQGKKGSRTVRKYKSGGYSFHIAFYQKDSMPSIAKMYVPIVFGNWYLLYDSGYKFGEYPEVLQKIDLIIREEQERFYRRHISSSIVQAYTERVKRRVLSLKSKYPSLKEMTNPEEFCFRCDSVSSLSDEQNSINNKEIGYQSGGFWFQISYKTSHWRFHRVGNCRVGMYVDWKRNEPYPPVLKDIHTILDEEYEWFCKTYY